MSSVRLNEWAASKQVYTSYDKIVKWLDLPFYTVWKIVFFKITTVIFLVSYIPKTHILVQNFHSPSGCCCCSVAKSCLVPLSSTISRSLLKFMSFESVMLSNHLILHQSLLRLPSIFPNIRVFSNELALCIRWPKYWSFSKSPSNECLGLISHQEMESISPVLEFGQTCECSSPESYTGFWGWIIK